MARRVDSLMCTHASAASYTAFEFRVGGFLVARSWGFTKVVEKANKAAALVRRHEVPQRHHSGMIRHISTASTRLMQIM